MQGAQMGDRRLAVRLDRIAGSLAKDPSRSLPKAMADEAALEATYRFLNNERVTAEKLLTPHMRRTAQRCAEQEGRVLAVFDTTELSMGGEREGLGHLKGSQGRGMLAHVGLAVSADGGRDALGVVHLEWWVRSGGPKRRKKARATASDCESLRWDRGVEAVYQALPEAICVMDREADIFELLQQMSERGQDFVVRATQDRRTEQGLLWQALDGAECVGTREIEVSARAKRSSAKAAKRFPPRSAHTATLELRTCRVQLCAPNSTRDRASARRTAHLEVGLVHVIERDPPPGEEPIEWVLLTSLPADGAPQVDFVVDAYRARWVIEELFKALKSGCAIEKRQLESPEALSNLLAISLPIAWTLLRLRHFSRTEPDRPGAALLHPLMLRCLRLLYTRCTRRQLPAEPTCRDIVWAIAALGGHIRNNGEPGLIVLGRGMTDLIAATDLAADLGLHADVINL